MFGGTIITGVFFFGESGGRGSREGVGDVTALSWGGKEGGGGVVEWEHKTAALKVVGRSFFTHCPPRAETNRIRRELHSALD